MKIDVGFVEFGEGHRTWRLPGMRIVDGKRQARMSWLATTKGNGSTHILGGLVKTASTAQRKAKATARENRRIAAEKALADFAKETEKRDRAAATAQRRKARTDSTTEAQATTWGNQPASGARRQRPCGQPTQDGTPCENPWGPNGCGADHTKAIRQMKAQARTASRGAPAGKTTARKTTSKTTTSKATTSKATKGRT